MFVASRGLETIRSHVQRFGTALRAPTMQPRLQRRAPRRAGGTLASAKLPNWRKTRIARYPPQMPSMERPSRNGDPERSVRYRSLLRDRAPRLHHFDGERGHQLRLRGKPQHPQGDEALPLHQAATRLVPCGHLRNVGGDARVSRKAGASPLRRKALPPSRFASQDRCYAG